MNTAPSRMIHLTTHAIQRARERLGCKTDAEATAALRSDTVEKAAEFAQGCECYVRLPGGQRVVICDGVVTTVLPARGGKPKR